MGRRLLALSAAASGEEAGAAFGFAFAGGTGTLGATRGKAWVGAMGVRVAAGDAALGGAGMAGVVTARAGAEGRSVGVKGGRCLTADSD